MDPAKPIAIETGEGEVVEKETEVAQWPLGYSLRNPGPVNRSLQAQGSKSPNRPPRRWWSHRLYRGPRDEEVQILYSRTKAQSELIAKEFENEPILGFDMEWPWNDWKRNDLQNKVGLIQLASETKIGLFHIGLHPGKTTDEIIAPTLRKIIESPEIGKVGVAILNADFSRLHRFFGLRPRGAIESSHLYRLVKFGGKKPELVSVKLVKLAQQVEDQLGYPLYKGDVRTSNWSKPLSNDQINYAAGDAYAGFMLYHCMNAKRLKMDPIPPLPIHADKYPKQRSKEDPLLLDNGDGVIITSKAFFDIKPIESIQNSAGTGQPTNREDSKAIVPNSPAIVSKSQAITPKSKATIRGSKAIVPEPPLDQLTQRLYDNLVTRRAILAKESKMPPYVIGSNKVLESLARDRPSDAKGLLLIKGIGEISAERYGSAWLEVISTFESQNNVPLPATTITDNPTANIVESKALIGRKAPQTPHHARAKKHITSVGSSDSAPAFGTPPHRPAQMTTGLSFTFAETTLENDVKSDDSDGSLPSLDFGSPSSRLKRKRAESPTRPEARTETLQTPAQSCDSKRNSMPPSNTGGVEINSPHRCSTAKSDTEPLTPRSRISKNKLLAFSRLVTRNLPARPPNAPPVVTDHTLDLIIRTAPQTQEELEQIVGVGKFILACELTGRDLLDNIIKFAPARS